MQDGKTREKGGEGRSAVSKQRDMAATEEKVEAAAAVPSTLFSYSLFFIAGFVRTFCRPDLLVLAPYIGREGMGQSWRSGSFVAAVLAFCACRAISA